MANPMPIMFWSEKVLEMEYLTSVEIMDLLQREVRLQQVVKLVGADVLPDTQRLILEACSLFKNTFLQQSAFDKVDMYSTAEKQVKMLRVIVAFYRRGLDCIKKGAALAKIRRMKIYPEIVRMKFSVSNEEVAKLDELLTRLEREFDRLEDIYERG